MPRIDQKPDTQYHMAICKYAEQGWRKRKDDVYQGQKGTFLGKDDRLLFIAWSGAVFLLG
jgi:hypothetical protein